MSVDVSIKAQKQHAARFAASFEPTAPGDAGVEQTRREPALLTDRQTDAVLGFGVKHLPAKLRDPFRFSVMNRLSGVVGDSAVKAAIIAAAMEVAGFTAAELVAKGLTNKGSSGRNPNGSKDSNLGALE
jgi:hypothetical protein